MGFKPITMDKYVAIHLRSNPKENEKELRKNLQIALTAYQNGEKCSCGNDIWVIGSASVGHKCFTCITGESNPTVEYEIDSAIKKGENKKCRRHIDEMKPTEIYGFFDDDGYEINTDLIKKPSLCITCINNENENEEEQLLCNMTRYDQRNEKEFICFAHEKK